MALSEKNHAPCALSHQQQRQTHSKPHPTNAKIFGAVTESCDVICEFELSTQSIGFSDQNMFIQNISSKSSLASALSLSLAYAPTHTVDD